MLDNILITLIAILIGAQIPLMVFITKLLWNINQRLAIIETETKHQSKRVDKLEGASYGFNKWKEKEA